MSIKRTNIQQDMIITIDFDFVQWSCKNLGWKRDSALLNAINARAIQSALEKRKANMIEATHHPSPKFHWYPK